MIVKGKRLMPTYLISFLKEIYPGDIPDNFGKRMVSRQSIAYLRQMYLLFGGESIDNFGRDMCPEYLIKYLEYLINADYIEYEDDLIAYTKETPENALKYAFLNYVGGMSYKSENFIVIKNLISTTNSTLTINDDGSIKWNIINTSASATFNIKISDSNLNGNYYFKGFINALTGNYSALYLRDSNNISPQITVGNSQNGTFEQQLNNTNGNYDILFGYFNGSENVSEMIFTPMLVKGSTAPTEFKVGFEGIRESLVTSVNSLALKNNDDKYGWGIDSSLYNYRDYTTNKGHKVVGRVDLGSLDWIYNSQYGANPAFYCPTDIGIKAILNNQNFNGICAIYDSTSRDYIYNNSVDKKITLTGGVLISIVDKDYTDSTALKQSLSGVYLYYELATEVEEDIDPIDNVIDVSSGETTFNNEYEQDVPSSISYFIPNV